MEIIHANQENFNETINGKTVILDFYATWCGPCKMLSAVIEELASDRADGTIVKIDVDESEELAKQYGVMSVPTLVMLEDGKEIKKNIGFMSKQELIDWIEK